MLRVFHEYNPSTRVYPHGNTAAQHSAKPTAWNLHTKCEVWMLPHPEFTQDVPPYVQTLRKLWFVAAEIFLELLNRCSEKLRRVRVVLCILRLYHFRVGRPDSLHLQRLHQRPKLVQLSAGLPKRQPVGEPIHQGFVIRRKDRAVALPALACP